MTACPSITLARRVSAWLVAPAEQDRRPFAWLDLVWIALAFAVPRLVTESFLCWRGIGDYRADQTSYLGTAAFFLEHGRFPIHPEAPVWTCPGYALLIAVVSACTGLSLAAAGHLVTQATGYCYCLVFHAITRRLRLTMLAAATLPAWVTSSVMAEGALLLPLALALLLWSRPRTFANVALASTCAGVSALIKPTMLVAIGFLQLGILIACCKEAAARRARCAACALALCFALLPLAAFCAFNVATAGQPFPEARGQAWYNRLVAGQTPVKYTDALFTWPGDSLVRGLSHPANNPLKKALVVANLGAVVAALALGLARRTAIERTGISSVFFSLALAGHLVTHLCIGGQWGYSTLDRYWSWVSPLLLLVLFRDVSPRIGAVVFMLLISGVIQGNSGAAPPGGRELFKAAPAAASVRALPRIPRPADRAHAVPAAGLGHGDFSEIPTCVHGEARYGSTGGGHGWQRVSGGGIRVAHRRLTRLQVA